jgi:hypothetical protein
LFFSFVLSCFLFGCEFVHHQLGILSCGDCARVASCCCRALSIQVLLYGCPGPPFESLRVCSLLVASIVCFLGRLLFFRVRLSMIVWNLSGSLGSEVWGVQDEEYDNYTSTQESIFSCSFLPLFLQVVEKGERRPDWKWGFVIVLWCCRCGNVQKLSAGIGQQHLHTASFPPCPKVLHTCDCWDFTPLLRCLQWLWVERIEPFAICIELNMMLCFHLVEHSLTHSCCWIWMCRDLMSCIIMFIQRSWMLYNPLILDKS